MTVESIAPPGQGQNSRAKNGQYERDARTAARDARAAELRTRGWTYAQIAAELGFKHHSNARHAVQRALLAVVAEPAKELRELELVRLDMMWQAALAVLEANHFTISNGQLMKIKGQPILDDAPVLAAVDRMLKIQERRSKLLGLDAPVKSHVTVTDEIDSQIQDLAAKLAREHAAT